MPLHTDVFGRDQDAVKGTRIPLCHPAEMIYLLKPDLKQLNKGGCWSNLYFIPDCKTALFYIAAMPLYHFM